METGETQLSSSSDLAPSVRTWVSCFNKPSFKSIHATGLKGRESTTGVFLALLLALALDVSAGLRVYTCTWVCGCPCARARAGAGAVAGAGASGGAGEGDSNAIDAGAGNSANGAAEKPEIREC